MLTNGEPAVRGDSARHRYWVIHPDDMKQRLSGINAAYTHLGMELASRARV
jgi:hypothetical protein